MGAIDSPSLRLDFDVSHFEVVGVPMDESVGRLAPLAGAAEIQDQHLRYLPSLDDAHGGRDCSAFIAPFSPSFSHAAGGSLTSQYEPLPGTNWFS